MNYFGLQNGKGLHFGSVTKNASRHTPTTTHGSDRRRRPPASLAGGMAPSTYFSLLMTQEYARRARARSLEPRFPMAAESHQPHRRHVHDLFRKG